MVIVTVPFCSQAQMLVGTISKSVSTPLFMLGLLLYSRPLSHSHDLNVAARITDAVLLH